jgi:hypothetical protein
VSGLCSRPDAWCGGWSGGYRCYKSVQYQGRALEAEGGVLARLAAKLAVQLKVGAGILADCLMGIGGSSVMLV